MIPYWSLAPQTTGICLNIFFLPLFSETETRPQISSSQMGREETEREQHVFAFGERMNLFRTALRTA